jgi:hypothetical protein
MKDKKYYIIYKVTNTKSNRFYIGQHRTDNIEDGYMGSGLYIQESKKKYKEEFNNIFKREILEYCDNLEELNKFEEYYILKNIDDEFCQNYRLGGNECSFSKTTIEKMSVSAKNRKPNMKGKHHSLETKDKIRKGNLGKIESKFTKLKKSISHKGKRHSKETKLKMSIAAKKWQENKPIIKCPHCNTQSTNKGNMSRWHFDNCKYR